MTQEVQSRKDLCYTRVFKAQDKRLVVNIIGNVVYTALNRRRFHGRKSGTTTGLYSRAKAYMQEIAESDDTCLEYTLSTRHPKMKASALSPDKGYAIFDWDGIRESPEGWFLAKKKICP